MVDQSEDSGPEVYNKRWIAAKRSSDTDILCFSKPKNQVEFFYLNYNRWIERKILGHFGSPQRLKLLEVGCGRATASIYLAKSLGADVTATDYSSEALALAEENMRKHSVPGTIGHAEAHRLPFQNEVFDVVLSLGVMEHISNPSDVYGEMLRVLRPGGVVISMNVPEKRSIQDHFSWLNNRKPLRNHDKLGSEKTWLDAETKSKTAGVYRSVDSANGFTEAAQSAGFKEVQACPVNPFPTLTLPNKVWELGLTYLYRFVLWTRKRGQSSAGFECSEKLSRCHFVVGLK